MIRANHRGKKWPVAVRPHHELQERRDCRIRDKLLSDASNDFIRESRILDGASQYYATQHRRCRAASITLRCAPTT